MMRFFNRRPACFLVFLIVFYGTLIFPQPEKFDSPPVLFKTPLSPRIANYDINVQLDDKTGKLQGKQVLTWKNTSNDAIDELQFHLYLNGFRNNKSTFMIESGGRHRGFALDASGWGFMEVNEMKLLPAVENDKQYVSLLNPEKQQGIPGINLSGKYIHPDTPEHTEDKTVLSVSLPRPIQPGESASVFIDFTAKLPEPPFARTGFKEEYFLVAQWFPKIGVYTDDGWNCHQFHRNSEFFADYGVYNVWMTVPEKNIVGATGLQVGEAVANGDGTATHFYHAEDVHDFAWTTSPEFIEFRGQAQDVDIRVLMQPDHRAQGPRHVEATKVAIEYFQNWYGDYPFPNFTVVDPRRGAGGSGGMEYPTFVTVGTRYGMPEGVRVPELVIIHEFGHNFWYHLLASNEFEESWLDEGINTYTEIQVLSDYYGPYGDTIDFLGIRLNAQEWHRWQYLALPDADPMLKNAWEYYSGSSYGTNSYSRPGIVLTTLQNYLGVELMRKVIRTYVERWRFKHPTSEDFIAIANEVSGQDLSHFFDQVLHTNHVLDYSVDRIFSRPLKDAQGYDFDYDTGISGHVAHPDDSSYATSEKAPVEKARIDSLKNAGETVYYSGVNIRRLGDFVFPVEIEMTFDDGEVIRETWDGKDYWKKFRYYTSARLVSATVDPENKLIMDVNFMNNSQTREVSSLGENKLSARWLFWMQFLLDQPEFLNLFTFFL